MKLLVGCPVRRRDWILDHWFDHVERACDEAGLEPEYVFAVDPHDIDTVELIERVTKLLDRQARFALVDEPGRDDHRDWSGERTAHLADLRNEVLKLVREQRPSYFWSIDSDVLAAPASLASAVELVHEREFAAVGMRTYMTPTGSWCPSYAQLTGSSGLQRTDSTGAFPVDVVMAAKLMQPSAYDVDYEDHFQGEDIGWSKAVRARGFRLGWDGRVACKHVMHPGGLESYRAVRHSSGEGFEYLCINPDHREGEDDCGFRVAAPLGQIDPRCGW